MKTFLIGLGLLSILGVVVAYLSGFSATEEKQECQKVTVKLDNKTETEAQTCKTVEGIKWNNPWAVLWLFMIVYAFGFLLVTITAGVATMLEW